MRGTEVSEFIDSAYTWQERAIKAEAEVERLKAENALLRKLYEAAKVLDRNIYINDYGDYVADDQYMRLMEEPLIAYMEWKEGER